MHDFLATFTSDIAKCLTKHHKLTSEQILALTATNIVLDYPSIRAINCPESI